MTSEAALLGVIDLLYAAAVDDALWPRALGATSDLLGAEGANFEVIDKADGRPVHFQAGRLPPESADAYVEHYARLCPRAAQCIRRPAGYVCYDRLCLSEAEMARDPFYAEFLRPIGLKYFVSGNVSNDGRYLSVVAAQRSPRRGHVGRHEVRLMQALLPHFARVQDISLRLAPHAFYDGGSAAVVHGSRIGILFLDRRGRVLSANPAAERILEAERSLLGLRGGYLELRAQELQPRFQLALRRALARPQGTEAGGVVLLRRAGRLALRVTVVRLRYGSRLAEVGGRAAVAVYLVDGRSFCTVPASLLREEFGLTPAECRLALALLDGETLAEYAARARIAMPTARTHIARVFQKTGARNQQALIRLLDRLGAPLP